MDINIDNVKPDTDIAWSIVKLGMALMALGVVGYIMWNFGWWLIEAIMSSYALLAVAVLLLLVVGVVSVKQGNQIMNLINASNEKVKAGVEKTFTVIKGGGSEKDAVEAVKSL